MPKAETNDIDIPLIKELFDYDSTTGKLTYRKSPRYGIAVGDEAGAPHVDGARRVMIRQRAYLYHRLCWAHYYGVQPKLFIDHINGDRSDCRIANLRDVELAHNAQNTIKPRKHSKLGIMGVGKSGNRFVAAIQINRRMQYLGTFDTAEEAHAAYITVKKTMLPKERENALS